MIDKYKKYSMIICSVGLMLLLIGVTYSFFNFTKTGALNNLGTGEIYFNSVENGTLNMTNVFPMTSIEAGEAQLDTVTVGIQGNTTYANGEEFQISLVDVENTIGIKKVPMNYIATYEEETGASIGESSDTYWESRESKNANIYKLYSTGPIEEDKQVLVGYIKNGETGINGTLTIKAYVDADRMAISDTYPEGDFYVLNNNITSAQVSECVSYFSSLFDVNNHPLDNGETLNSFCDGTGTAYGWSFQYYLQQSSFSSSELDYLENHNIIVKSTGNGTTNAWVNGREVFTTSEWNSMSTSPISFKIKAESNEGIWAKMPMEDMCPGCVFTSGINMWTTWNPYNQTPEVLTHYHEDYHDLLELYNQNYFLGVVLNQNNQIERAYACGMFDETTPYCIEGSSNGAKYEKNQRILQSVTLWNNSCTLSNDIHVGYEDTVCDGALTHGIATSNGDVNVSGSNGACGVTYEGTASCASD